jgi:hypothetical protein
MPDGSTKDSARSLTKTEELNEPVLIQTVSRSSELGHKVLCNIQPYRFVIEITSTTLLSASLELS